jgi:hypothetical protein
MKPIALCALRLPTKPAISMTRRTNQIVVSTIWNMRKTLGLRLCLPNMIMDAMSRIRHNANSSMITTTPL